MATSAARDYADTPYARAARERKAVELEDIARMCGVHAADLVRDDVRAQLLAILSEQRGKRVTASTETWRVVWRFMHDHETRGVNPFGGP